METTCTLPQQLVGDLGHFIGVTLEKEKLSSAAEKSRAELHQRLQTFIVPEIEVPEEEEYEDPAPIRVCSQISNHSVSGQSDDGSNLNITLNDLKRLSTKYGPLWRKERGIFRDVWRKHFAGLFEQKLILFCSEKDPKPTSCVNIQGYVARPAPNIQRDNEKKKITFELICPGKKDYQFLARTTKDMEQWVAMICQTSIQHLNASLPLRKVSDNRLVISTDESDMETYDDATSTALPYGEEVQTEEEFYDDIVDPKHTGTQKTAPMEDKVPSPFLPVSSKNDNKEKVEEEEEEEFYNDIEEYEEPTSNSDKNHMMWHVERKFDVKDRRPPPLPPVQSDKKEEELEEEEEIYHDIVEYQQKLPTQQKLPPKPIMKSGKEKLPPLPPSAARRPLPSIPIDEPSEEEEEIYEDINASGQSHMKQSEQNVLQISDNKTKKEYEEEDDEETYDDIGNHNLKTDNFIQTLPVTQCNVEGGGGGGGGEEEEEIYDDAGDSELSPQKKCQFVLRNESTNSNANIQNIQEKIGKITYEGKVFGLKEKPVNITISLPSKQTDKNNQVVICDKLPIPNVNSAENIENNVVINQSFLKENRLEQIGNYSNLQNKNYKLTTDITDAEEMDTEQKQLSKQNSTVKDICNKFNQPKNTSFLYRHSSQEDQGNVNFVLKNFQSKNTTNEGNFISSHPSNPNSQSDKLSTNNVLPNSENSETSTNNMNLEKTNGNFQNAFKKLEGKPIGGHVFKPNVPANSNQSSTPLSHESPTNSLGNTQNRSLPPKPVVRSPSLESPKFSINASRNKFTPSRPTELHSHSSRLGSSSSNSRTEFSLQLPTDKSNITMNGPSVQISVSPRHSPKPLRNKSNLSDKPDIPLNKPSVDIRVTMPFRNSTESSKISLRKTSNKPNGLPVPIPVVPDSPTSEAPKLPARTYLKR